MLNSLDQLNFENLFVRDLPADPITETCQRKVDGACYSRVSPLNVKQPRLLKASQEMLDELELDRDIASSEKFLQVFSGNRVLSQMKPYAMCYGGHQFGHWAGQLGDGRAINLGEVKTSQGKRWTLQLKGAGPTPYSRGADGLAVLRSSLREFLCSEAMYHLGVPTTRALSLVLTGEQVERDMFYDGHPQFEPGAVVCRVSPSFLRFGNFQIFSARKDLDSLKTLLDFCLRVDFPHLPAPSKDSYLEWFNEVCRLSADMVVHWMRVGFVHGVMNTDNMSVLGLTIDYGPYGWLEDYNPDWTPNTTDAQGKRYRYSQQPQIVHWNLLQLAEAIYPLIGDPKPLEQALTNYAGYYQGQWQKMMSMKLGFTEGYEDIEVLFSGLHEVLQWVETDMTLFFRNLADVPRSELTDRQRVREVLGDCWYQSGQLDEAYWLKLEQWLGRYQQSLEAAGVEEAQRIATMNAHNPRFVLRNYLAQLAIDAVERGDHSVLDDLMEVLRRPYDEQPKYQQYAKKRPEWARHRPGCSMLSCSS